MWCGHNQIQEFLCFDHGGYAATIARKKWLQLGGKTPSPIDVDEAVARKKELIQPELIEVKQEGKYQRLLRVIKERSKVSDLDKLYQETGINL